MITVLGWIIIIGAGIWATLGLIAFFYEIFRDQNIRQLEAHVKGYIVVPAKIISKQIFPCILVMIAAALMIKYLG